MTPPSTLTGVAAGAVNIGSRQAALLLHGIGHDDRQWLLGELAAGQRALLEGLLGELHALGVPPSPGLIDDTLVTASASASASARPAAGGAAAERGERPLEESAQRLSRVPSSDVAEILRDEPDALVARTLRIAEATWGRKVRKRLGVAQRRRIEQLDRNTARETDAGSDNRLQDAILHALAAQAERLGAVRGGDLGDALRGSAVTRLGESFRRLARRVGEDPPSRKNRP